MFRLYYEQVSDSCNHLSQILMYFVGHPLLVYMNFLYGKELFISAFQSESLGGKGLIHFLAIIFRARNSVLCINVLVYLSIESDSIPIRHVLGFSVTGEPILSCRNVDHFCFWLAIDRIVRCCEREGCPFLLCGPSVVSCFSNWVEQPW